MRGKAGDWRNYRKAVRITPAYAGKSFGACFEAGKHEDHPRLCGEKSVFFATNRGTKGSPPPMRGKATTTARIPTGSGITPAYAGKRVFLNVLISHMKDHPRLCGEKTQMFVNSGIRIGSPPPMRGKVYLLPEKFRSAGITPAYAGKSTIRHRQQQHQRDHPRLCGEKL